MLDSDPLLMRFDQFVDTLETIEGMEDPSKSIMRCYLGEDPTIRLYHGEKLVATTNREEATYNPEIIYFHDVGYWMLRAIKQYGSPLSVHEAERLGRWRFSSAYPYIETAIKSLAEIGVAERKGQYTVKGQYGSVRCDRFDLSDLTQFFVSHMPPANQSNDFLVK